MSKNNSFFEKLGRSLKLEDASLTDYDPDQDDMDEAEELNEEELDALNDLDNLPAPDSTEELELDEEMLKEISENNDENENDIEGPVATLAAAKTKKTTQKKVKAKPKTMPKTNKEEVLGEPVEEGRLNLDVYEVNDDIVIKSAIAGVEEDDLDIEITSDTVTIRGERSHGEEVSEENYFNRECYWGAFSRGVHLYTEIDPDKAEATLENGILTIRLPKLYKSSQKKLKVKKLS